MLRVVGEPAYARLLVGASKDEALSIVGRAGSGEPDGPVTVELTAHELHVLYATLAAACMNTDSHEVFHVDTGYYVENVRDLASALENGIVRAQEAGG